MAWINNRVNPQIAIERGWNVWEVFLSNWNVAGTIPPIDVNSLLFPNPAQQAAIPSSFAVAIGPNSTVDRCWLEYNPNIDVNTGPIIPGEFNYYRQKLLAIDSPVWYPVPGNLSIHADYNCNAGDDFIVDDGAGTLGLFEWEKGKDSPAIGPLLHLIFYLQPPALIPTQRYPQAETCSGLARAGATKLVRLIPCYGRKTINVVTRCFAGTPTVRIGLLTLSTGGVQMVEYTQATVGPMAVNDVESTLITPVANASFLSLWVDGTAGAGAATFNVEMIDG